MWLCDECQSAARIRNSWGQGYAFLLNVAIPLLLVKQWIRLKVQLITLSFSFICYCLLICLCAVFPLTCLVLCLLFSVIFNNLSTIHCSYQKFSTKGTSWWSSGYDALLPVQGCRGPWVWTLVGELSSHVRIVQPENK